MKEQVLSEITRLRSEYERRKEEVFPACDKELGAIDFLECLQHKMNAGDDLDATDPEAYLSQLRWWCDEYANIAMFVNNRGSGANPKAVPGRNEACRRVKRFMSKLVSHLA